MKIADIIRVGIADGRTNEAILADVLKAHPEANTNAACVNWYRNQAKKATNTVVKKAADKAPLVLKPVAASAGHGWSVKNLKSFNGLEGAGYNATLLHNGVKVAEVIDDASGGEININWTDYAAKAVKGYCFNYMGEKVSREMSPQEKLFNDYVLTLPIHVCNFTDKSGKQVEMKMTEALFVDEIINDAFMLKQLRSLTKGKIAFITLEGKLYTMKGELGQDVVKQVLTKHVGAVILNNMSEQDAVACMKVRQ